MQKGVFVNLREMQSHLGQSQRRVSSQSSSPLPAERPVRGAMLGVAEANLLPLQLSCLFD